MNGPGDGARFLLTALMAGWAMAFAYSFYHLAEFLEPASVGEWMPDITPAMEFLRWQGVALLLAIATFGVSLAWPRGAAVRGIGALPLSLAALVAMGMGIYAALT